MTVLKLMVNLGTIDFLDDVDSKLNLQPSGPASSLCGRESGQVHLATLMCNVGARLSKHVGCSVLAIANRKAFVRDVCLLVGQLWESSRHEAWWNDTNHLQIGVLTNPSSGRTRRISPAFKKSLITETRNNRMKGIRRTSQMSIGMGVLGKPGPVMRLSLPLRRSARRKTSKGQVSGRGFEEMVFYNYFLDTRSQTHVHGDTIEFSEMSTSMR